MKKRYYLLIITLIAATILVITRWKVWFGQPEESPYNVSKKPWRVMLTFGNEGELSRMVSWQCDSVLHKSWLELQDPALCTQDSALCTLHSALTLHSTLTIPAEGEVFQSRAGKAAYYYANLKNLRPNTRYRYRVVTNNKTSPWYEFHTYGTGKRDFAFIYVGDVQDTIGGIANQILREAFHQHPDAEFLVCGGDLTERPRDIDWAQTFRGLDSLRTAIPILTVTGNHDYLKELPRRLERRFSLIFPYFLRSMVGENQVYSMTYAGTHFYLIDTDRELPYLLQQKEWLEEQLNTQHSAPCTLHSAPCTLHSAPSTLHSAPCTLHSIVILHHPLYSMRDNNNLIQRWVFADLIESHNVDLVLQGHEHNYGRLKKQNTVYTISHCSPKNYSHKDLDQFDITHIGGRYYQYIRLHNDTLTVTTHEVYTDKTIDSLNITKRH